MIKKAYLCAALTGLALGTIQEAFADAHLTFQVDMSSQVGSTFNPPGDTVSAHGSFNGWGAGVLLTNNPAAANTNLYTGTIDETGIANGGVLDWKYVINNGTYETTQDSQNRCAVIPSTSGSSEVLDIAYFDDAGPVGSVNMTFRVDMAEQIYLGKFNPATSSVYCQGLFEGWSDSGAQLTNDPTILRTNSNGVVTSNVYTGVFQVFSAPGGTEQYKFVVNNNDGQGDHYESAVVSDPDNYGNRFFDGQTNDTVMPIVFFSDTAFNPTETNVVTFQVDMGAQIADGNFNPATQQVNVNGAFNNWSANVTVLTNHPTSTNAYLYTGSATFIDGLGAAEQFKYTTSTLGSSANTSYEGLAASTPDIGGNRYFNIVSNATLVLPVVYYADTAPPPASEELTNSVTVTFTVNMTNAVGTDSTVWSPSVGVYINGDFTGWQPWTTSLPQMTETPNDGNSSIYTYTTNFAAGHSVVVNYQYSMNGVQDETPGNVNHVRYIRSYGTYNFPVDTFGAPTTEASFGNLAIGGTTGGVIPITWSGRPGVQLQYATNLHGPWTTIPGTDAISSTNITVTGSSKYFRLIHPLLPLF